MVVVVLGKIQGFDCYYKVLEKAMGALCRLTPLKLLKHEGFDEGRTEYVV